jgi:hypothetical protein
VNGCCGKCDNLKVFDQSAVGRVYNVIRNLNLGMRSDVWCLGQHTRLVYVMLTHRFGILPRIWGVEVWLHVFLTLELDGDEWLI